MSEEYFKRKMEDARRKLNCLEVRFGLRHASVLEQSKLLDELINEYHRLYSQNKSEL